MINLAHAKLFMMEWKAGKKKQINFNMKNPKGNELWG